MQSASVSIHLRQNFSTKIKDFSPRAGGRRRGQVCYREFNISYTSASSDAMAKKKFPLVTSKTCPPFISFFFLFVFFFSPKLNTTVKIHRAQRIHICSTRYTLYKLDREKSTERLSAVAPPARGRCCHPAQRMGPLLRAQWGHESKQGGDSDYPARLFPFAIPFHGGVLQAWLGEVFLLQQWEFEEPFFFWTFSAVF